MHWFKELDMNKNQINAINAKNQSFQLKMKEKTTTE